jgi:hypothetical protein
MSFSVEQKIKLNKCVFILLRIMHRPGHETILNQKTKRETAPLASFVFGKPVKRQEGNRKPNKVRSFMAGRSQTLAL